MLTEPQADQIRMDYIRLAEGLTKEQLKMLYFCLDDLLQYRHNSLPIAYKTVSDLFLANK